MIDMLMLFFRKFISFFNGVITYIMGFKRVGLFYLCRSLMQILGIFTIGTN